MRSKTRGNGTKQNDFAWSVCRATKTSRPLANMRIASCCVGFSACKPTHRAALSMAASTSTVRGYSYRDFITSCNFCELGLVKRYRKCAVEQCKCRRRARVMTERLPQMTSGPSGGMNRMNATRQGVQVNILGSNGAAVGLPMFIPSNQSQQSGQVTHVSPPDAFTWLEVPSIGLAREVRCSYLQSKASYSSQTLWLCLVS